MNVIVHGEERVLEIIGILEKPTWMGPALQRTGARLVAVLKAYPPPLPDQRYRRTGTLGRRWTHTTQASLFKARAIIGNNTSYAPDVQGEGFQAEIHRGRWRTAEDVLEKEGPQVAEEELNDEIDRIIN